MISYAPSSEIELNYFIRLIYDRTDFELVSIRNNKFVHS